jgi:hypothetical protein
VAGLEDLTVSAERWPCLPLENQLARADACLQWVC